MGKTIQGAAACVDSTNAVIDVSISQSTIGSQASNYHETSAVTSVTLLESMKALTSSTSVSAPEQA